MKPETRRAIEAFHMVCMLERSLELANTHLENAVTGAAKEDEAEYFRITEGIRRSYYPEPDRKQEPINWTGDGPVPRCLKSSNLEPPLPCQLAVAHKPPHEDAQGRTWEDPPKRCGNLSPAPIALRCMEEPGHKGRHKNGDKSWPNKGKAAPGTRPAR